MDLNPVNGEFWRELARARYEVAEYEGALAAATRAFEFRAGSPAETALLIARCYARLGDVDHTLDWIESSIELGLRDRDQIRNDEAISSLQPWPWFHELLMIEDVESMSRDDGWRFDLQFLATEFGRLAYDPFDQWTEENFELAVERIDRSIPDLTDAQILLEFNQLLVPLGDGHAYVFPAPDRDDLTLTLPLQFYLYPEGLYVIGAAPEHAELLGGQVLAMDDRPIREIIAAVEPTICRDNDQWPNEIVPFRLRETPMLHGMGLIREADRATLTVCDLNGSTRSVLVKADHAFPNLPIGRNLPFPEGWVYLADQLPAPKPLYLRDLRSPFWFEHLPKTRTVYFQFNSVRDAEDETLGEFTERLFNFIDRNAVEHLIIDMRWNKGGNTTLEWPFIHRLLAHPVVNRKGALFAIIGRRVFSAAQNFATYLDLHTEVTFVGEPTGSSPTFVGENIEFRLPWSRSLANVSDLLWQSGWPEDRRTWIAPEIYAPPAFAAFRENRDPALEAILAEIA